MSDKIIETIQLTKRYGDLIAVDRLDWNVPSGSICGMLGPNGAGKTTTLKILVGMNHPTSGKALVQGLDAATQSIEILRFYRIHSGRQNFVRQNDCRKFSTVLRFVLSGLVTIDCRKFCFQMEHTIR